MKKRYKIKPIEKEFELEIPKNKHIVIRLDGKRFSKFTKKYFKKPFDLKLSNIMIEVMKAIFKYFNASFGYTQSDEITIIIPKNENEYYNHIFNGRIQKIASISSSVVSSKFNSLMYIDDLAIFDSRVFGVDDEMLPLVINERRKDCIINSKSAFSQAYCSHKELLNKNSNEMIEYTNQKFGKDWHKIDDRFKSK